MKTNILVLLALACASVCAFAQNVRYSAPFPSVSTLNPPYLVANLPPNSPVLAVCSSPANALPCTNYATTYTSLGVACLNGAQDTPDPNPSACQSTGDAQGNIAFWAPAGTYDYTVCVQNQCFGPYTVSLGGSGGGGNVNTGSNNTFTATNIFNGTTTAININNEFHAGGNSGQTLAAAIAACPGGTVGCHVVVDGPLTFTSPITYAVSANPLTIECVGSSAVNLNSPGTLLTYTPASWSIGNSVALQISNNTRFNMKGCNLTQGNSVTGPSTALTNIVGNGSLAQANCSSACSYAKGQIVNITGNAISTPNGGFNIPVAVTAVTGTSFSFASPINSTGSGGSAQTGVVGLQTQGSNGGDLDHSQIYNFTGVQYQIQDATSASGIYNTCEGSHFRGGFVGTALTQFNTNKSVNSNTFTNCTSTGSARSVMTTGVASENVWQGGENSDPAGSNTVIVQFGDGVTPCRENDFYTVTTESTGPSNQIGILNGCAYGSFKYEGGLAGATPVMVTDAGPGGTCHKLELAGGFAGGPNSENTCLPLKWNFNGDIGIAGAAVFGGTPITINAPNGWGLAAAGTTALTITTTGVSSPIFNATTGFRIGSAAPFGHCLVGDGTNYVDGSCPGGGGGGGITGIGTTGFVPLWTSSSSIGNSALSDNAVDTISSTERLNVASTLQSAFTATAPACSTPISGINASCAALSVALVPPASQTADAVGAYVQVAPSSPPASGAANNVAIYGNALTASTGAVQSVIGVLGQATPAGTSGSVTEVIGVKGGVDNKRVATRQAGFESLVAFSGGNVEPLSADFYGQSPNFSSVVSHHYGVFLEDQCASGSTNNPDCWAIFTTGTAKSQLGGALNVTGALTLSNLTSAGTQCMQVSSTGIVSGTGSTCGSGGSGSSITINGGAALGATVDFRNGTGARIFNGITMQVANPTGSEVEVAMSGALTNAGLANSAITLNGTANQLTSPGSTSLGGTATFAIANPFIFPGKATFAASTTAAESFNIPSGVAATSPASGDVYNKSGILHFFDSVNDNSLVTIQTPLVNGHIPKANGVNGLISDGYSVQGTDSALLTAGTVSGTAASLCTDANGGATTVGCGTVGLSGMVANGFPIAATGSTITSSLNSNVTGQVPTFQNGGPPVATSPGLLDSTNSPVTSASYTLACDNASTIIDRAHLIRFQSPAATPIVPLSTATGCTGGFVAVVVNESAGSLVFSRTGSDTFSIYNGSTASLAQTSFTLANGQYATLNQGATGIWEVLVKTNSSLPSGTQGRASVNTTGSNAYATTDTYGIDLAQFSATIPFTTTGTTPTVDVTSAFNTLIGALPIGSHVKFPRNAHYKFACTAGAQACVPIQTDGLVFECTGGPGPQYSASLAATPCSLHVATAGAYLFGVGIYTNSTSPTSGPQFKNITFVDDTALSNAQGPIKMVNVNDVVGDNLTAIGGFRQPAIAAPSAPTCTASNAGGSIGAGSVQVKIAAWTNGGPTLASATTTCASSPIVGSTGSVSIVIPAPSGVIIGYEAYCKVAGASSFVTCSPLPTYTTNGDGSQTINLQSTTPLVVTVAPTSTRAPVAVDLSHSNGIACEGSIGWAGAQGFCNGPRFKNLKSYFTQGAWTCGIGGASCNLTESELMPCDVVITGPSTGTCGAGAATPGLVVGLTGLRLTNVHVSGSQSSPSTGVVAALSGFNNVIIGGTFQSNTAASTEIGVSLINATGTVIKGLILANYGTCLIADSNSNNNQSDFATNGSCNGGAGAAQYTDNGTANQWWEAGKLLALGPSTTATAKLNLAHGSAPTAPNNGDLWTTTTGMFARINGVTQGPFSASGTGTVTSVAQTVPSGFAIGGSPVTTTGTLAITYNVAAAGQLINSSASNTAGFTATPSLGVNGGTGGSLTFNGSTSGSAAVSVSSTGVLALPSGTTATSMALTTPNIGAATGTSLLVTGNVDGTAPITITTGTTATLGAGTFKSGYTFNQEATAGTAVTYTLPATAVGLQYCVRNSIVSGTGAADTGVLTVYPPSSSFVILNGVRNTVGGGGTHGVASGGAAGDSACFVAIDATDWEVYTIRGTWTAN